jgi:SAM-dependent methyltransferase
LRRRAGVIEGLLERYLQGKQAATVLDVGPGYGNFSRVAARVTGATKVMYVDCSRSVLDWQAKECRKAGIEYQELLMQLDGAGLCGIAGTYDIILCQEVLEHLVDAEGVLQALARRLAPGGRVVVTVPTRFSERWLKWINPSYMENEPYGHVRQFDEPTLRALLTSAGLTPLVFIPTQPHYFLLHTWVFGTRMKVEGSTGQILTEGFRRGVGSRITEYSRRFFRATGPRFWGRLLPRNYFVIAVAAP